MFANGLKLLQGAGTRLRAAAGGEAALTGGATLEAGAWARRERAGRGEAVAPAAYDHLLIGRGAPAAVTDQYRMLRTRLLQPAGGGRPPRTVLVASALAGEGRTSAAANLAITIARSVREHVLLVDGDLRSAGLGRLFGLKPAWGLADYLRGGPGLAELLVRGGLPKLSLLPAGARAADGAELLASERMRDLLGELAGRYEDRLVVIDSPPLLESADAAILAAQVEAVVLVVRAAHAERRAVGRAVAAVGCERVLGVVFNAVAA